MTGPVVGLIDSGIGGAAAAHVTAHRSFTLAAAGYVTTGGDSDTADPAGHGSALADILLCRGDAAALYDARVFDSRMRCSAAQLAAALDWLRASHEVRLVNLSVGLRRDRPVLRRASEEAVAAGMLLVASAPARGEPVFPAAYPGVIAATGDARCAPGEISHLDSPQADFGAHVRAFAPRVAGASVGCAHVTAYCSRFLARHPEATSQELREWLIASASYRGIERRLS